MTNRKDKKRASFSASSRPNKRAKGTASQPIHVDLQAPAASPPLSTPPIINALQALRFIELRPKNAIAAPAEGSKHATAAASEASKDNEDKDLDEFEAYLMDKYNGID
ncbi:hypothetical protein EJ04DRAFT_594666, partial [Polyplosphaeria fusca]